MTHQTPPMTSRRIVPETVRDIVKRNHIESYAALLDYLAEHPRLSYVLDAAVEGDTVWRYMRSIETAHLAEEVRRLNETVIRQVSLMR